MDNENVAHTQCGVLCHCKGNHNQEIFWSVDGTGNYFLNEVTRFKEANAACSLSSGTLNFKPSDVSI